MTTAFTRVLKLPFAATVRQIVDTVNQLCDLTVQKAGPLQLGVKTLTNASSPYTVIDTDELIKCDCSSGNITVNLPSVATVGVDGRQLTFKKITTDIYILTIDGSGSETIDGNTTRTIQGKYESHTIRADASTGWDIVAFS